MRILFLLTQSLDYPSGLGRYWPLARYMTRLGYDVEIAALHPFWAKVREREFVRDGVKVSYVAQMHVYHTDSDDPRRRYFSTRQLFAVTARATLALALAAHRSHANVIHIAKGQPMNGLAGWLSARLRQRKLFLDCDDDEAASNRFSSAWQRDVVLWFEKRLTQVAQGITVNTNYLRERCIRWGVPAVRVRLIPNGFDPERFQPVSAETINAVRRRWGLDNYRIVLYLGSLSLANHPILLLLDAFVHVHAHIRSAVLLIVGGGEDFDYVREAIHKRRLENAVIMTGRIAPDEARAYYAASDVVVDPVLDDAVAKSRSPLKIVEALAMGIPVVTGNIGDRATMLGGGRAGVLVEPGSAEALAEGIIVALSDCARREEMVEHARAVSQQFRWDYLVQEFVKTYEL